MKSPREDARPNPFATRFIRPGALDFLFPHNLSASVLVERLDALHWRAAITGPHGVGKSTLLATLVPALAAVGRNVISITLHAGERELPGEMLPWSQWRADTQLVIDGYEQLSWWSRWRLAARLRFSQAGALVTMHRESGWPVLIELFPKIEVAVQVVRALGVSRDEIADDRIRQTLSECGGNMREMLFRLYDLYEDRSRR